MVIFYDLLGWRTTKRVHRRMMNGEHGVLDSSIIFQIEHLYTFAPSLISPDSTPVRAKGFIVCEPMRNSPGLALGVFLSRQHIAF